VKLFPNETTEPNGLDPNDYLRRVVTRIADHMVKRVHELLPRNTPAVRRGLDQCEAA